MNDSDCGELALQYGNIVELSPDGRFGIVQCSYGSNQNKRISIECIDGTWANNRCEPPGKYKYKKIAVLEIEYN